MLDTIADVKEASKRNGENGHRRLAALHVLYSQQPRGREPFIEVRQWATLDGEAAELVAEYGRERRNGELETQCAVLPYWWGLAQALTWVNEQVAALA